MISDDVASPCTGVCVIDQQSGWCRGCHRTLTEISYWMSYTRDTKLALLETLAQRASHCLTVNDRGETH